MNRSASFFTSLWAVLLLSHATASGQAAPDYRQWTDKTSGKQIEASMVSADVTARTVTIQKKDGASFTLPIVRLADADLAYIKAKLAAPATAATTPAPAAPATAPAAVPGKTPAAAPVAAAPQAPVGAPAPARPVVAVTPAKKFKHPAGGAILSSVKSVRPRLIMNAEGFAALKARVASDPTSKAMFEAIQKTGEDLLTKPELTKSFGEENPVGRQTIFRFSHLGILSQVTGDPRWKDRGVKELLAVSKDFTNWSPTDAKICSEFVTGMAIGYDYFRTSLNPDQAKIVRAAMVQLGFDALMAHLKGEPIPATTKRPEPGQAPPENKPSGKTPKKPEDKTPPDGEEMITASALMLAAISLNEDEPNAAGPAANLAAKVLGDGVTGFSPDGIWPESLYVGDEVLDSLALVISSFRSACGSDFGYSTVEGLANIGLARMYLSGPKNLFNYGSSKRDNLDRYWITSWLASLYGNPGVPAIRARGAEANVGNAANLNQAGALLYHSPYMGGYGTPDSLDKAFTSAQVATLRTAWNDPNAMFVGIKGGKNDHPGAQLDLGTFVLDAGGVRWAVDLGAEDEKQVANIADPKRFKFYREGSLGQNIIRMGGTPEVEEKDAKKKPAVKGAPAPADPNNQAIEATATISGFVSTPERGVAIVDLSDVFTGKAKGWHRGAMVSRGPKPYVIIQDEFIAKSGSPEWVMHTKSEVTTAGNKATLKSGNNLLTASIISPAGATFISADPPTLPQGATPLTGIKLLKIVLANVKGPQMIAVAFASGDAAPEVTAMPMEQWLPKKK